jgi:DNA-binding transcriptional MerR regulator
VTYSTREAAEVVGLTEATVRGCVRAGFLAPSSTGVSLRFHFRDLLVLRVVKALIEGGVSMRRIRRQLRALRSRLPSEVSLSELSIAEEGGHVVVRSDEQKWHADSGQVVFDFYAQEPAGQIEPLPVRREAAAPVPVPSMTSDEWFERAVELEDVDAEAAMDAYRRALHLRPDCTETLINLGRLRAENGDTDGAADCFRDALRIDPRDATALYNLGVVAQDEDRDPEAIDFYCRALDLDPTLAEAHYNLATLFDRAGDGHAAIRHINAYRKLTRQQPRG